MHIKNINIGNKYIIHAGIILFHILPLYFKSIAVVLLRLYRIKNAIGKKFLTPQIFLSPEWG